MFNTPLKHVAVDFEHAKEMILYLEAKKNIKEKNIHLVSDEYEDIMKHITKDNGFYCDDVHYKGQTRNGEPIYLIEGLVNPNTESEVRNTWGIDCWSYEDLVRVFGDNFRLTLERIATGYTAVDDVVGWVVDGIVIRTSEHLKIIPENRP